MVLLTSLITIFQAHARYTLTHCQYFMIMQLFLAAARKPRNSTRTRLEMRCNQGTHTPFFISASRAVLMMMRREERERNKYSAALVGDATGPVTVLC